MKTQKITIALIIILALICGIANAQIHVKDNQSFHIGVGNDGVEIELSRNLYIRSGINLDKTMGCFGINISDSHDDQWVNHFGIRLGKMHRLPAGVFGVEYGVDKKINDNLFIGGRVYNDWEASPQETLSRFGWGIRLGFYL